MWNRSYSKDKYEQLLQEAVGCGLQASKSWPDSPDDLPTIHHSTNVIVHSVHDLVKRSEVDKQNEVAAVCFVENISFEWAVILGCAWRIEPGFFVEYLKKPDFQTTFLSFTQGRVPGSDGCFESTRGGTNWQTMRGVVDYGRRNEQYKMETLHNDTIRAFGETDSTIFPRHIWHTNLSFYHVHDKLTLILVDRYAKCRNQFSLVAAKHFPYQTIVRLAFEKWPGHVAFPDLFPSKLQAVLPLWRLLIERDTCDSLFRCLQDHGIDDFLYKAAVFECHRHLNGLRGRINSISFFEERQSEKEIHEALRQARLALNRLYRCVAENRHHERSHARLRKASANEHDQCDRTDFRELEDEVLKLDKSVLRTMEWLSTTMSIKDSSESLRLTGMTMKQTQSMALLTRLAFVYAPLTFTTGIFGMNLRQINDSQPLLPHFLAILSGVLTITALLAWGFRRLEDAADARGVNVGQLFSQYTISKLSQGCRTAVNRIRSLAGLSYDGGTTNDRSASLHEKSLSTSEAVQTK